MKNTLRITFLMAAVAVALAACEKHDTPVDNGTGNNGESTSTERLIIYTVDDNESRRTLTTDSEWDAILNQLCDLAQNGSEVTFYNINHSVRPQGHKQYSDGQSNAGRKEKQTINTTSRDEIKNWMKEMEKKGLTVRVSYDTGTGSWHGEAYATAPTENTHDLLVGTWRLTCMVVSRLNPDGQPLSSDLYEPEDNGGSMYYTFTADGTVSLTINGIDSSTAAESGLWSLSDDGILNSELLPNGEAWNVSWITGNTMILSHNAIEEDGSSLYYQLQFESVTAE